MKRLFSLILAVILVFTFAACGKKDDTSKDGGIDLEYYAELGSIPECEYSLGQDIATLKAELEELYNTEEEAVYNFVQKDDYAEIDSLGFQYYYLNDKESEGVSYIVALDKAFGFNPNTVSVEITDAFKGYDYTEEALNDKNSFFILGAAEGKVIKYKFKKNTVSFVFINDALFATAIYKTGDWE